MMNIATHIQWQVRFGRFGFRSLQRPYSGENSVEKVGGGGGGGGSFANFRQICFDFAYYFVLVLYLSNCLIRRVCKKSFLSFSYFSMVIKNNMQNQNKFVRNSQSFAPPPPPTSSTEVQPLYMCCNIHHFGITKRKVMASKLQVTPTKLQVTRSKQNLQV